MPAAARHSIFRAMKSWRFFPGVALGLLMAGAAAGVGLYLGLWNPNMFTAMAYPIHGIDVSHHQGAIDWRAAARDRVEFAYIKATEGRDFVDSRFAANWKNAAAAGIPRGAYHFFSPRSPGREQARHFLSVVPADPAALPPAVDLEFDTGGPDSPRVADFRVELDAFLSAVREARGSEPVIYTTREFYGHYLSRNPPPRLWLRDIVQRPKWTPAPWTFWQYASRGRIRGVPGYVDLDAFVGDLRKFKAFARE